MVFFGQKREPEFVGRIRQGNVVFNEFGHGFAKLSRNCWNLKGRGFRNPINPTTLCIRRMQAQILWTLNEYEQRKLSMQGFMLASNKVVHFHSITSVQYVLERISHLVRCILYLHKFSETSQKRWNSTFQKFLELLRITAATPSSIYPYLINQL